MNYLAENGGRNRDEIGADAENQTKIVRMTKPTGVGRGGWRPGSGRKPKPRPDPSGPPSPGSQPLSKANGDVALPTLHRLVDDARVDLGRRLRRVEDTGADNSKRLKAMQETLQQVLRHQTAIGRALGTIELTTTPRHTRRRPLGT